MTLRPVGVDAPTTVSIAAGPLVGPILRRVVGMLAASAGNDMLQATFSWMCAHASTEQKVAQDPSILGRGVRQPA